MDIENMDSTSYSCNWIHLNLNLQLAELSYVNLFPSLCFLWAQILYETTRDYYINPHNFN
jgi:hypothetical protein